MAFRVLVVADLLGMRLYLFEELNSLNKYEVGQDAVIVRSMNL